VASAPQPKVSFPVFFHIWATAQGWQVPRFHYRMAQWLESRGQHAVMMVFRGAAKSTILAIYNAWRYYCDPGYRILHQGADDGTAFKTSRDTRAVLERHPLTRRMGKLRGEVRFWWVPGSKDARNASMQAAGILSNVTSSRADEVQNDDVEVPKNIGTIDAREKMRYRLGEQTHIRVPGSRLLYIGTPHTFDSLYDERIAAGADLLRIPMYEQEHREQADGTTQVPCPFEPEVCFVGVGAGATAPMFRYVEGFAVFDQPVTGVVDMHAGSAWPERFTRSEMLVRRQECRTLNEWDSQYQLHARPLTDSRLNESLVSEYRGEPVIREVGGQIAMLLNGIPIVSATCKLDPSSGKVNSDVSALCLVLQDASGNLYWHRALALKGELATFGMGGKITGGQAMQIADVVEEFELPRVIVETNGIGGHVPTLVREALRQRGLVCGVTEQPSTGNKQRRILAAFEPAIESGRLWVHASVWATVAGQFRGFNPAVTNQEDDYLDAAAGAIAAEPVRIGKPVSGEKSPHRRAENWTPQSGVYDVTFER
jgi:hypothetical protein